MHNGRQNYFLVYGWLYLFLYAVPGMAQSPTVHWISFAQLKDSIQAHPKPIFIHIHTEWCRYCRLQETRTYRQQEVIRVLNEAFYTVRLDAEAKEPVRFAGRTYTYQATGPGFGYHALAAELGKENGRLSYPTVVVLDHHYRVLFRQAGFQRAVTLLPLLEQALTLPRPNSF